MGPRLPANNSPVQSVYEADNERDINTDDHLHHSAIVMLRTEHESTAVSPNACRGFDFGLKVANRQVYWGPGEKVGKMTCTATAIVHRTKRRCLNKNVLRETPKVPSQILGKRNPEQSRARRKGGIKNATQMKER
jgi:hypothetical protein